MRYNNVVIATDADVDGMHIRLLIFAVLSGACQRRTPIYLADPLILRNKKETKYCYSTEEKNDAIGALGPKPEITRFKGLGEISPDEFKFFIGQDIRLEPVMISKDYRSEDLLTFYMGKIHRNGKSLSLRI